MSRSALLRGHRRGRERKQPGRTFDNGSGCRHVNKKALDQFLNFTEQREILVKRHEDAAQSKDKIRDLVNALDLRKNEAISRTFRVSLGGSEQPEHVFRASFRKRFHASHDWAPQRECRRSRLEKSVLDAVGWKIVGRLGWRRLPGAQGIAKNFREIFSELAPGGKGELVMQKAQRKERGADEDDPMGLAEDPNNAVDQFSGVKVKVSRFPV